MVLTGQAAAVVALLKAPERAHPRLTAHLSRQALVPPPIAQVPARVAVAVLLTVEVAARAVAAVAPSVAEVVQPAAVAAEAAEAVVVVAADKNKNVSHFSYKN